MNDWIETALAWTVHAKPAYRATDEAYRLHHGYDYGYFSPFRPLNWIGGQIDHMLLYSTQPGADFIFTKEPLPVERLCKWELVPWNDAARSAINAHQNAHNHGTVEA